MLNLIKKLIKWTLISFAVLVALMITIVIWPMGDPADFLNEEQRSYYETIEDADESRAYLSEIREENRLAEEEAKRLAKEEADRIKAEERAEAARIKAEKQAEKERLAEEEAKRIAAENEVKRQALQDIYDNVVYPNVNADNANTIINDYSFNDDFTVIKLDVYNKTAIEFWEGFASVKADQLNGVKIEPYIGETSRTIGNCEKITNSLEVCSTIKKSKEVIKAETELENYSRMMCKEVIKSQLRYPTTADFNWLPTTHRSFYDKDHKIIYKTIWEGESKNGFGNVVPFKGYCHYETKIGTGKATLVEKAVQ